MEKWFVLVNGVSLQEESVKILDNLLIRKIPDKFNIFDLASLGSKGFKNWTALEGRVTDCIEILTINDTIPEEGYDFLNRAWLLSALLILKGYFKCKPLAYLDRTWVDIAGIHRSQPNDDKFEGGLLDEHKTHGWIISPTKIEIEAEDILWIQENFEKANHLAFKSEIFKMALQTLVDWSAQPNQRAAVALIWSSIESIIKVESEITFRSSLYLSSILYPRGKERYDSYVEFKKLYGLRSRIVHGAKLKDPDIAKAIYNSQELLKNLVFLMIDKNEELNKDHFEEAVFY